MKSDPEAAPYTGHDNAAFKLPMLLEVHCADSLGRVATEDLRSLDDVPDDRREITVLAVSLEAAIEARPA